VEVLGVDGVGREGIGREAYAVDEVASMKIEERGRRLLKRENLLHLGTPVQSPTQFLQQHP
jgi:hypothetical protein